MNKSSEIDFFTLNDYSTVESQFSYSSIGTNYTINDSSSSDIESKINSIVLEDMGIGVIVFSQDGILKYVNHSINNLLVYNIKQFEGRPLSFLLMNASIPVSLRKLFVKMYRTFYILENQSMELQIDNETYLRIKVLESTREHVLIVNDITFSKVEERVNEANDSFILLGKLSASIAHEIRNPLTSIKGFIQLLKPYLKDIGKMDYAKVILFEIDRVNQIIHQFLNTSKASEPDKKAQSLQPIMNDILILIESEALMRNCEIITDFYNQECIVNVDAKQLKQVILNLLKNAFDAIEDSSHNRREIIHIKTFSKDKKIGVKVTDYGKGMDCDTMKCLFSPFFTTKSSGTGLGLSVSKRIIEKHGGTIEVSSILGEGSSFTVYLPVV